MSEQNTTIKKNKGGNPNFIPKWKTGETKTIRLPVKLHNDIMYVARLMDNGLTIDDLIDSKLKPDQPPENLEEIKLKILKSFKLGSQSPTYKKIEKALNQFIEEVF